jgi:acetylornithine/succinyldiaminopimelate/putrescine aminotransferase
MTTEKKLYPHRQYINPNAEAYNKRLMGTIDRLPLVVDDARDSMIHDVENEKQYLDYWIDGGVLSLGYNTPEFYQAMFGFLATLNPHQLPDMYPNQIRWDCAEVLCSRVGMDKVFFANSGAEANEAAIKMARKYWYDKGEKDRYTLLTFKDNFHGRQGYSLCCSDVRDSPYHKEGFGPFHAGFGALEHVIGSDGKVKFYQVLTNNVPHEPREPDWNKVGAIITAPVLSHNRVVTFPEAFWREMDRIREQHGVLLILDEVLSGNGRCGTYAAYQGMPVKKPDMMTVAKGIALGFPMSAFFATEEMAKVFTPGTHFTTFGGSPFVCYMATYLYHWLDKHLPEIKAKGEWIRSQFDRRTWINEYDGIGLLNAFTPDYEALGYDGFDFTRKMRELGVSRVTFRKHGQIGFTPRLNVPMSELEHVMGVLDQVNDSLTKK